MIKLSIDPDRITGFVWTLIVVTFLGVFVYSVKIDNIPKQTVNCEVLSYSPPYTTPRIKCRDMFSPKVATYTMSDTNLFLEARSQNWKQLKFTYQPPPKANDLLLFRFFGYAFGAALLIGLIWFFLPIKKED